MLDSFKNIVQIFQSKLDEKEFEIPLSFNSQKWSAEITGSEFFYKRNQ